MGCSSPEHSVTGIRVAGIPLVLLWTLTTIPMGGCDRGDVGATKRLNVVFLVVDTLRSDHVGCYGSQRNTTPTIDALAAEGTRFARAYATAPWTMPSVASMISGLLPSSCRNVGTLGKVPDEVVTLAETFKEKGYATAGFVSHCLLGRDYNYHQGFDIYSEEEARHRNYVSTNGLTRRAVRVLRGFAQGRRPFFLFVHYFDPHYNYKRHAEYGFAAPKAGRLDGTQSIRELRTVLHTLTAEEVQFLQDLYDEEIRFTDAGIGRLLDTLRRLGLYDDTIIVLVGDHGEEFLDRGWLGHTTSLYDELVRVPFIIRMPDGAGRGRVVETPVSLVSLMPTLLDLADIDPASLRFHGRSLAELLAGEPRHPPATIFCEVDYDSPFQSEAIKKTHKKAMVQNRYKLIRDDFTGKIELYDLQSDPGETRDLSNTRREVVEKLLPILEDHIRIARSGATVGEPVDLSSEEIERLRGLGYIGS